MRKECNKTTNHNRHLFDNWTERSAYLLGYLEADGHIVKNSRYPGSGVIAIQLACSTKDRSFLDKLKELSGFTGKTSIRTHRIKGKEYQTCGFTVRSREWNDFLTKNLRTGHVPSMPAYCVPHYIRGYLDGDGSIYWQGKLLMVSLVSSSQAYLEELADIIEKYIGESKGFKVYSKTSSRRCWYIRLSKQDLVAELGTWLYQGASIALDRKQDRMRKFLERG